MNHNTKYQFISWNVRGLNDRRKRIAIRQTILIEKPDIVCMQETKLSQMNSSLLNQICGRRYDEHRVINAIGTRGGILIATRSAQFQIVDTKATACCLSVWLQDRKDSSSFWFTGVYGPSSPHTRVEFLEEIKSHKPQDATPWILGGDFNITLTIQDRNRPANSADWRNTRQFAQLVSDLGLLNLNLQGRTFTWTNERDSPAMARLDRFLISNEWNLKYPNSSQKALPSTSSDHCPLSLTAKTSHMKTKFFRFENIWLKFEDLPQLVTETWQSEPTAHTPDALQKKLKNLQTTIKNWSNSKIGSIKV